MLSFLITVRDQTHYTFCSFGPKCSVVMTSAINAVSVNYTLVAGSRVYISIVEIANYPAVGLTHSYLFV